MSQAQPVRRPSRRISALHKGLCSGVLLLAFLWCAAPVWSERSALESGRTNELLMKMAEIELLQEVENKPLLVRLYLMHEGLLECDGGPVRCPQHQLCILIMRSDFPTQRQVYLLPVSYGWDEPRIVHRPDPGNEDDFFILEAEESVISKNAIENDHRTWYDKRKRRVRFNLHEAYLQ